MSAQIVNFRPNDDSEWLSYADCTEPGGPDMFPDDGNDRGIALAKTVCQGCPVRVQCLTSALDSGERFGIWGGFTTDERRSLRINSNRAAREHGQDRETTEQMSRRALAAEAARKRSRDAMEAGARAAAEEAEQRAAAERAAEQYSAMLDAASDYVERLVSA